jgi:hypothetical protein
MKNAFNKKSYALLLLLTIISIQSAAQTLLNKNISVNVSRQRLDHALEIISNTGNFYFSYNSNIIKSDSLVSINASNRSVREVLTALFGNGVEFRESGNYIIIRRAPIRLKLVTSSATTEDRFYVVSGYVLDDQTGERLRGASVYEKDRLSITNTNSDGYFKLRLKSRYRKASITVSKEFYEDTTVSIEPKQNQTLTITLMPMEGGERTTIIGPIGYEAPETIDLQVPISDSSMWIYRYQKKDSFIVERTAFGKFLLSSTQKLQSINLRKFFTARPYQISIVPGLSTNGKLNSQVVNNFSFNILGGYSGGTNGLEIGGLFNIDKKDVKYVQSSGIFNLVGGNVEGVQVAGVSNTVIGGLAGAQVSGVTNYTNRKFSGAQIAGVYNHAGEHFNGAQIAGVVNFTNHRTNGAQIAGVANISSREVRGVQVSGVFNYTRRLKGVQIGLINVSDTSSGYSIGLINIVFKGYHKLSLYATELVDANAAFKTGNAKLYNIFLGSYNTRPDQKLWSYGYGLGTEIVGTRGFALNLDLTAQQLHRGSWDHYNILSRATLLLNLKLGKYFSIFVAPAYNVFVSNQNFDVTGYKSAIPSSRYNAHSFSDEVTGWVGWSAGVNIF